MVDASGSGYPCLPNLLLDNQAAARTRTANSSVTKQGKAKQFARGKFQLKLRTGWQSCVIVDGRCNQTRMIGLLVCTCPSPDISPMAGTVGKRNVCWVRRRFEC